MAAVAAAAAGAAVAALQLTSCRRDGPREPIPAPRVVDTGKLRGELAALRGKPVVVNFWASWCDPCIEEFPELVRAARKWRERGVRFVSVSADDPGDLAPVRKVLERFGAPFDALLIAAGNGGGDAIIRDVDPEWTGALPATFLYDAAGRKVRKRLGTVNTKMLDDWLAEVGVSGR